MAASARVLAAFVPELPPRPARRRVAGWRSRVAPPGPGFGAAAGFARARPPGRRGRFARVTADAAA
jgi:hypothetical protein